MNTTNPFHLTPAAAPVDADAGVPVEPDPLWDDEERWQGPPVPPPTATPGSELPAWPQVQVVGAPSVCVMGLHGGAGASTVTALLGPDALEVGTAWPVPGGWARPLPVLRVLAVARTHYRGLQAATDLAQAWAARSLTGALLVGLVLVDDAPDLTTAQRKTARRLGRMTPHGWHLPWQEAWRLAAPELPNAPIRVRRVVKSINNTIKETK